MLKEGGNVLEKVLSSHVLWYNDEGVYIRALLSSAQRQVNTRDEALTGPINSEAIAAEREDLAAGFVHHGLRQVLRLTDMFDEFHGDLLYELECRLPRSKPSAPGPSLEARSTLPSLRLL